MNSSGAGAGPKEKVEVLVARKGDLHGLFRLYLHGLYNRDLYLDGLYNRDLYLHRFHNTFWRWLGTGDQQHQQA